MGIFNMVGWVLLGIIYLLALFGLCYAAWHSIQEIRGKKVLTEIEFETEWPPEMRLFYIVMTFLVILGIFILGA